MQIPQSSTLNWKSALNNPPAESGWYPCSIRRNPSCLRWFDKEKNQWSEYCPPEKASDYAAHVATRPTKKALSRLSWADPYWN